MNRAAWWTCALLALCAPARARVFGRCELARELRALGVHPDHISTWVCIAYHESRFDTTSNNPYSGDHGIFQISEIYWCGVGKACGLPCSALRDDDIADDVECALVVHEEHTRLQGDGFLAWVVYPQHCKQSTKKYLIDCEDNLKNATAPSEVRSFNVYTPQSYDSRYRSNAAGNTYSKNLNIDTLLPPYLSVSSIFRGSYGKVLDYNQINGVDWYNYKYDKVDELTLPRLVPGQSPATPTIKTTTTTTTYVPPVKPWRYIETNQFRKKALSPDKTSTTTSIENNTTTEKSIFRYTTYKPSTELTTRESLTTTTTDILPKVKSTNGIYKSTATFTSTTKPVNIANTAYKSPAFTTSYETRPTNRPSTITFGPSAGSLDNFVTSAAYGTTSSVTTSKPSFQHFIYNTPKTTVNLKTTSTTVFTFPPWAFKSRTQSTSTTTMKPSTTTQKPTTSLIKTSWYSSFFTPSTQKPSYTTTTRKPTFLTTSTQKTTTKLTTQKPFSFAVTTQKPIFSKSTPHNSFITSSTTKKPFFFTTTTTPKSNSFSSSSAKPYVFFTTSTTQKPKFTATNTNTTTQSSIFTKRTTEKPQRTSRTTQDIFDLYLNPTKPPQLKPFSFSSENSKFRINIFSGGTTTVFPSDKGAEEQKRTK